MPPTLLINGRVSIAERAAVDGDALWLPLDDLETITGWVLKLEGACFGERCVPIPVKRLQEFVRDGLFNIARLARHLGQPVVRCDETQTWLVGDAAADRAGALRSLQAPDFTLPDIDGRSHSLSDYRGRKVFLVSWASW